MGCVLWEHTLLSFTSWAVLWWQRLLALDIFFILSLLAPCCDHSRHWIQVSGMSKKPSLRRFQATSFQDFLSVLLQPSMHVSRVALTLGLGTFCGSPLISLRVGTWLGELE